MRYLIFISLIFLFLCHNASSTERVFILVSDTEGLSTAESIAQQSFSRKDSFQRIFSNPNILSTAFLFDSSLRYSGALETSTKGRMARYLVSEVNSLSNAQLLVSPLSSDPRIIEAYISDQVTNGTLPSGGGSGATTCENSPTVIDFSSFSKTWAQEALNIEASRLVSKGGATIVTVDFGIYQNHPKLRDFNKSTNLYQGGNFHQHLAIDHGGINITNTPFHFDAAAVFGTADEYLWPEVEEDSTRFPNWLNCDDSILHGGNDSGTIESDAVGHGTHVAGLISGSDYSLPNGGFPNSGPTWLSSCEDCSLQILRSSVPFSQCYGGAIQPHTSPPRRFEALSRSVDAWTGIVIAAGVGAQIINASFGAFSNSIDCSNAFWANRAECLAIEFADSRDVIISAAAGNNPSEITLQFPALDPRVVGVAGISSSGSQWVESSTCGSTDTNRVDDYPHFAAPAEAVYSTMYPNTNYNPSGCHVKNDGDRNNGFGYCTGTSMAAPLLSGILGLVRTTMPLAPASDVINAVRNSSDRFIQGLDRNGVFGYGVPDAEIAVQKMLGNSAQSQLVNRLTPLLTLHSLAATDSLATTKPQIAMAFAQNADLQYSSNSSLVSQNQVNAYSFSFADGDSNFIDPKADVFLFTTHVSPDSLRTLLPLYRMRSSDGLNQDSMLALESELNANKLNDLGLS